MPPSPRRQLVEGEGIHLRPLEMQPYLALQPDWLEGRDGLQVENVNNGYPIASEANHNLISWATPHPQNPGDIVDAVSYDSTFPGASHSPNTLPSDEFTELTYPYWAGTAEKYSIGNTDSNATNTSSYTPYLDLFSNNFHVTDGFGLSQVLQNTYDPTALAITPSCGTPNLENDAGQYGSSSSTSLQVVVPPTNTRGANNLCFVTNDMQHATTPLPDCYTEASFWTSLQSVTSVSSDLDEHTLMAKTPSSIDASSIASFMESQVAVGGQPSHDSVCASCGFVATCYSFLVYHARRTEHPAFGCRSGQCQVAFKELRQRDLHELEAHADPNHDHARVQSLLATSCDECGAKFNSMAELHVHAIEQHHVILRCKCAETFSRIDVLIRHLKQNRLSGTTYPCLKCKRHRGVRAFKRKDHLTQHLQNYHHVDATKYSRYSIYSTLIQLRCPYIGCPQHRDADFYRIPFWERDKACPFEKQSVYTKHMQKDHDYSPYPCDLANCPKVAGKGFFRKTSFLKHRKSCHPDARPFVDTGLPAPMEGLGTVSNATHEDIEAL